MKNAISIYGQLRGNKDAWNSIKIFIKDYLDADVFIHTWITNEDKYYVYNIDELIKDRNLENESQSTKDWYNKQLLRQNSTKNNTDEIINTLTPKSIIIDEQKIFNNENYFTNYKITSSDAINYQNIMSQVYSRKKSIESILNYEKQNNIIYDNIYQIRTDIQLINYINSITVNGIYKNNLDVIIYGDRLNMINLSNMFDDYCINIKHLDIILPLWHLEYHIDKYINEKNIKCTNISHPTLPELGPHGIKRNICEGD
jgi:hypothetical protein